MYIDDAGYNLSASVVTIVILMSLVEGGIFRSYDESKRMWNKLTNVTVVFFSESYKKENR